MKYKGKSKEFLLETIYELDSSLYLLEKESNDFYEKPLVSQIYHLICCYIQGKLQLKTKFKTMITTDLAQSLTMINKFEKGLITVQAYKQFVSQYVKTKQSSCRTCGGGANAKQMHDTFQKNVFGQLKALNPLVFGEIEFVSAKYRNLNGKGTIEFYNYNNLYQFIKSLTEAMKRFRAKKLYNEADLVMQDLQSVKDFVAARGSFDVDQYLMSEGVEIEGDLIVQKNVETESNDSQEESNDSQEESNDLQEESKEISESLDDTSAFEPHELVEQSVKKPRKPRKKKD